MTRNPNRYRVTETGTHRATLEILQPCELGNPGEILQFWGPVGEPLRRENGAAGRLGSLGATLPDPRTWDGSGCEPWRVARGQTTADAVRAWARVTLAHADR